MRRLVSLLTAGVVAAGLSLSSGSGASVARASHLGGVIRAQAIASVRPASNPANGTPPLIWHGGPVMGTASTGPVVVTPIYWHPSGHPMESRYKNILTTYLGDVARDSGLHTNVYGTLNQYSGSNGQISYQVRLGRAIDDTGPLPPDSCNVGPLDTSGIYADGSGYNACLDDAQVAAETQRIVAANSLPVDLGHVYVLYLPKHVESCFNDTDTTLSTPTNACTINHYPSAVYCAYHNYDTSNDLVYANMPFPIYSSPVGYTCGSDARFSSIETPNGNPDADTQVSPTSHEIMESITDPDTVSGWYDSSGYENGDECAYVFGPTAGRPGALYNQVIHRHYYLTQEEFSNQDWLASQRGCKQSE